MVSHATDCCILLYVLLVLYTRILLPEIETTSKFPADQTMQEAQHPDVIASHGLIGSNSRAPTRRPRACFWQAAAQQNEAHNL